MQLFFPTLGLPKLVTVAIALLPLSLSGCNSVSEPLKLSTGSPTGYYYRLGQVIEASVEDTVNLDLQVQESEGSLDNLQQLLEGEIDVALVQLDVAEAKMKTGEIKAIAVLAEEHIHLITRQTTVAKADAEPVTLSDLNSKTIAIGTPGSGIRFTAEQLLQAARLDTPSSIQTNDVGFSEALDLLSQGQVDAAFYVGRLGANERLREAFASDPSLKLLSISSGLTNFLAMQKPGVYRAATIPEGIYGVFPNVPNQTVSSLTTPTVLITRPDANPKTVRLITWSLIATARRYATFYPELHSGDPNLLLRQGLFFVHPDAVDVYEHGDPRRVWVRYWENNSDLQAGLFLLVGTSVAGMVLRYWQKRQSQHLVDRTHQRIIEINERLTQSPQEALGEIEELSQDNRLQFIAGKIPDDVYAQVQQTTQTFSDQCRSVLDQQRREQILNTLLLLDDWQETLQSDPEAALSKLSQIKQQYREMLLSNQVDIQAYMELTELTLISVMTLAPKPKPSAETIPVPSSSE
ncbi:MAG: TAXI family TRAP transporter solute-binding subunit [Cyanobacteria bacterium]|jgi:TRAP transporter TAXI family solute receptor|nr:TAXI family TRAP transporter solute-binding subunit [Cyanobacteria bacterium GSL.Bin1]